MANMYINNMSDLWSTGGTVYNAIKMNVTDSASNVASKLLNLQVGTVEKFTVDKAGNVAAAGTITSTGVVVSGTAQPPTNDTAALGTLSASWSDLYLAQGGVITWSNNAGAADVTITEAADLLTFAGAGSGYRFDAAITPVANAASALGTAAVSWSSLFLANLGTINYANGNWVATHTTGAVTVSPGDLRVTTAGTDNASVVTVGGTQTLTSKTLTSPTINTPTMASPTISGNSNAAGATWANLGTVTTIDINGGTIDGTVIGATTPAAIAATTISGSTGTFTSGLSSEVSVSAPQGNFTTDVTGGRVKTTSIFESTDTSVTLAPAAGNNTILFRPKGALDGASECSINSIGDFRAGWDVYSNSGRFRAGSGSAQSAILGANSGAVILRPIAADNGTAQSYAQTNGGFYSGFFHIDRSNTSTATSSFYNGEAGPQGAGSWGAVIRGNSAANVGAGHFMESNGQAPTYLAFHQPNVNWWGVYSEGPIRCVGLLNSSDESIKSDIRDCDCADAHAKVCAIPIKSYRKKDFFIDKRHAYDEMGFIAQDVERFIPEAVFDIPVPRFGEEARPLESTETVKSMNDRTMLGTLWAAVQHQAGMIERLEAKIAALEGA